MVASKAGLNGTEPTFYFKAGRDGSNFVSLTLNDAVNFTDTGPNLGGSGPQCYTPCVLYWSNAFHVVYDRSGTATAGTNNLGYTISADLIHWTNAGPIYFTNVGLPEANMLGSRWYVENGTNFLLLNQQSGVWITWPTNNTRFQQGLPAWATPVKLFASGYDGTLAKQAGIYHLFYAGAVTDHATNSTLNGLFTAAPDANNTAGEGPQILQVGTSNFVCYSTGDQGASKRYASYSTNLNDWTTPVAINENGNTVDNGSIELAGPAEQVALTALYDHLASYQLVDYVYDLSTTGGNAGYSPTNYTPFFNVVRHTVFVTGNGNDSSMAHSLVADLSFTVVSDDTFTGGTGSHIVGDVHYAYLRRPDATWDVTVQKVPKVGYSGGGTAIKVIAPSGFGVKWRVRERVECVIPPDLSGTEFYNGSPVGSNYLTSADFGTNSLVDLGIVSFPTNYVAARFVPVAGKVRIASSNGILYKVTQQSTNLMTATAAP